MCNFFGCVQLMDSLDVAGKLDWLQSMVHPDIDSTDLGQAGDLC